MKKYFFLILSSLMICACSGNKTQSNASADTDTDTVEVTDVEGSSSQEGQELLWGFASIDNDQLDAVEEYDREEFYLAQEFLMAVLYPGEGVDTYSEEWVTAHCTPEMKQFLRDQYDYDGDGYAKWLLEGRFAGEEEYNTEVIGFGFGVRNGKNVYSIEKNYTFEGMESFVRNLYFGLERKGDDFVINSFEMNLESKDPTVTAFAE